MGGKQFTSTIPGTLDGKGRVCIPSVFRQALELQGTHGIYVCKPVIEPVIECFGQEFYDETQTRYAGVNPLFDADMNDDLEYFNAHTSSLIFDANGRVRLPDELIANAGLVDKVMFVGGGKTFKICTPEQFAAFDAERAARIRARMLAQQAAAQAKYAAMAAAAANQPK
ncbi:MAG: hypothetical protein WCD42_08410, partial [Rhizomicrobium sp.]